MTDRELVQDLLDFIDASPSPWHAVDNVIQRLETMQFQALNEIDDWQLQSGGRYYVVRDGSSIIAFVLGEQPLLDSGFKIIGAHTDSPGFRIKPNAAGIHGGMLRIGVEIYGGPILATFTDRDLGFAGRLSFRDDRGQVATVSVCSEAALMRLPNLAIHMNRGVNESGLKLNKQTELPLLLAVAMEEQIPKQTFNRLLADLSGIEAERILSWELNVYDTQPGAFWGAQQEFYADSQLDNLASCHNALSALLSDSALASGTTNICAFFDHEEIGSESAKGADGSFLPDVLERIACVNELDRQSYRRALSKSLMISADMAHAYQPNFPAAYEPEHQVFVNKGPVIKINANHRYTSESVSEALFANWCEQLDVPYQKYSHRSDIPCGSTIGPMTSAKLGIRSVDVGNPMWAMHSARESAGIQDHAHMTQVMEHFFSE